MKRFCSIFAVSLALALASAAPASASDLTEGQALYAEQCQLCHGSLEEEATGFRDPTFSPRRIDLAMLDYVTANARHVITDQIPAFGAPPLSERSHPELTEQRIAVAMPYGPSLRGIVGRPAATVEGYIYSEIMLKTLKGMEWTEAALNVWITDTQGWVPGVYMYYKQEDPEIRRKIILYLKANP